LGIALGCARPGRKGTREHLQLKKIAQHEGRLEDTRDAASPGAHRRRIDRAELAATLGCALAQPSPHLHTHHKVATARRPAHRITRHGGLRLKSQSGIKGRAHRRAAAAVHRRGTDPGARVRMVTAHTLPFPAQNRHGTKAAHRAQGTKRALRLARWRVAG
jgi:hypothetical protein